VVHKIYLNDLSNFYLLWGWKHHSHLKVPKCEIFDRSDFNDFYTIKSLCEGDFGVKIKKNSKNI
jgi:hypothetical protein